jgi:hypothetical protein
MLFEAYHSHKPVVGYLKTFGYVGFVKDKRSGLKKLDHLSVCMVFIEYSKGAKACMMLDPSSGRVRVSCYVIFDENRGWQWTTSVVGGDLAT